MQQLSLWDTPNQNLQAELFDDLINKESLTISTIEHIVFVEEMIESYMRRHHDKPELVARLYGSFLYCKSEYDLPDGLIKSHIVELLDRVVNNVKVDKFNEATKAECVYGLTYIAKMRPPTSVFMSAYIKLLSPIFPELAKTTFNRMHSDVENYPGQVEELIEKAIKTLSYQRHPIEARFPQTWKLKLILGKKYKTFERESYLKGVDFND